jgi:hypothetical protein
MPGNKAQAARARGRDGDGPAQQRAARQLGVHRHQARSGTASSSGRGGSCAGPRVRTRSGLQLEQAVGSTGEKKKEEASTKKRDWEKFLTEK